MIFLAPTDGRGALAESYPPASERGKRPGSRGLARLRKHPTLRESQVRGARTATYEMPSR
jgi:hypothetical protein